MILMLIMDNMWVVSSTPIAVSIMLICVLQIGNCIRFWRRPKDNSYFEQYPILSYLFVSLAAFGATVFIVVYVTINLYATDVLDKIDSLN